MTQDQVELALSLYRDVRLVREVVAEAKVPAEAARVAIALDASEAPPLVLVERDGRFVTCLAAGMKTDLPIIARGTFDALVRRRDDVRRRLATLELQTTDAGRWFNPVFTACERLPRETVASLEATAPIMAGGWRDCCADDAREAMELMVRLARREHARRSDAPVHLKLWRRLWSLGYAGSMVAVANADEAERDVSPDVLAGALVGLHLFGFVPLALRATWGLIRLGKPAVPELKRIVREPEVLSRHGAMLGLAGIALAHPKVEAEVRKCLERLPSEDGGHVLALIDAPDRAAAEATVAAADLAVRATAHLPVGHPARWRTPEEVPADLRLAFACSAPLSIAQEGIEGRLLGLLPLLARERSAAALSLPEAVLSVIRPLDGVAVISDFIDVFRPRASRGVVRAEPAPGRNDPCACGSGKKSKKCCAA